MGKLAPGGWGGRFCGDETKERWNALRGKVRGIKELRAQVGEVGEARGAGRGGGCLPSC